MILSSANITLTHLLFETLALVQRIDYCKLLITKTGTELIIDRIIEEFLDILHSVNTSTTFCRRKFLYSIVIKLVYQKKLVR